MPTISPFVAQFEHWQGRPLGNRQWLVGQWRGLDQINNSGTETINRSSREHSITNFLRESSWRQSPGKNETKIVVERLDLSPGTYTTQLGCTWIRGMQAHLPIGDAMAALR